MTRRNGRLRIAQVTFACHRRGGIERVVYELSRRLAREHEVHVFAGSCELEDGAVIFHKVPVLRWPWALSHLAYFVTTARALRRSEARAPFDIIHVQGVPSAVASHVTTAHSVHCRATQRQKRFLPAYQRAWRYAKTLEPLVMWLTGYNFRPRRCRRVIAISRHVKDDVVVAFGMPPERVEVIPNGVDVEEFTPVGSAAERRDLRRRLCLDPDRVIALFVANDFKWKGLDTLIRSLARIAPERRPLLLVVGDSRDSILTRRQCERLARQEGVAAEVRFIGAVSDVAPCYRAADFFVLPTVSEPFGIAILEALACGLPAVFSRLAGAADIVEDGREAVLLDDPTDPEELAGKMAALAGDGARREGMGRAARAASLRYSWDAIAERTLACYAGVLSEMETEGAIVRSSA